ncbi:MAG: Ig-like domain-containing protein [Candidatus Thiodiazotropha taylori]
MKQTLKPIVAACALALVAGQAQALDVYLIAKPFELTLPGGTTVPMWGYAPDTITGDCFNSTDPTNDAACTGPMATAPGPRILIDPTDPTYPELRIHLTNLLPLDPASIVIPGQPLPHDGAGQMGPTWNDNSVGARGNLPQDLEKKVRSFGLEAAPNGGRMSYVWDATNPIDESGTLMYHTGTHPQKSLYMGLYGAVTKDAATGNVLYDVTPATGDEVTYDNEVILFYSDIDPDFNASVDAGTLTTALDRHPSWFLVNGQPYAEGDEITMGTNGNLSIGEDTLLRFLSATTEKHVHVLQGLYATIHAEDGIPYTWQDTTDNQNIEIHAAPREQSTVGLPPLKTKDAIVTAPREGSFAVYDGNGYMTNWSDPDNDQVGDTIGGMLSFLTFGAGVAAPPVANPDPIVFQVPEVFNGPTYTVTQTINVLANDSDPNGDALNLESTTAGVDSVIDLLGNVTSIVCPSADTLNPDQLLSCDVTLESPLFGPVAATLNYDVTAGPDTVTGNVDISSVVNPAPIAPVSPETIEVRVDELVNDIATINLIDLVTGYTDNPEDEVSADATTVSIITDPSGTPATFGGCDANAGTCTIDFSSDLAPRTLVLGFDATDGVNVLAAQTVNLDLVPAETTLVDDTFMVSQAGFVSGDLTTNDLALPDLPAPTFGLIPQDIGAPGVATVNTDGTFTYQANDPQSFAGDTFEYCLLTSPNTECQTGDLTATVTIDAAPQVTLVAIGGKTYATDEDILLNVLDADGLLTGESAANGGVLSVEVTGQPQCTNSFGIDLATGAFQYEPQLDWFSGSASCTTTLASGNDSITYRLVETYTDDSPTLYSNEVTAEITVNPVNDPPVALNDTYWITDGSTLVLNEDGEPIFEAGGNPVGQTFSVAANIGVLANDEDPDGDTLIATEVNDPDVLPPALGIDGAIPTYYIDNNLAGVVNTIEYEVTDMNGGFGYAQADIVRQISVTRVTYDKRENDQTGNDRWRLRGAVNTAIDTTGNAEGVEVFLVRVADDNVTESDPVKIVPTATNNNNGRIRLVNGQHVWAINVNNVGNTRPDVELPDENDYLIIEVINPGAETNTIYERVPISILP